ncbi:auxin-responsive protein SAUR32 [Lactuca sativa]|nr:auxin-responsive protein SAUR32 [Lactuca sativa]
MESSKSKSKRKIGLLTKTWERCKSFGGSRDGCEGKSSSRIKRAFFKKRKSWSRLDSKIEETLNMAPTGCFFIYVGPQRQRFVIKTKHANHPLFKTLLEEAEFEYGYKSEGPLKLPCDVDDFLKVLLEMEECDQYIFNHQGCTFGSKGYRYASNHHLTSCKIIAINNF